MKKIFMILSVCLMASLAVVACKPDGGDNKKDNGNEQKPDDGKKPEEEEFKMEVAIDGNFAEWDALTEDTADNEYYLYGEYANESAPSILRAKLTSDADYVYAYVEINYNYIYVPDQETLPDEKKGPYASGDSNTGFVPHPDSPGPLWFWIDADGDATGAVTTPVADATGEIFWADLTGIDVPLQYYFLFDPVANKMQEGWQQINYPAMAEDGSDWGRAFVPGENWDPTYDNLVTPEAQIKFSGVEQIKDPVTGSNVPAVKIELAMDRSQLLVEGDLAGTLKIGVSYENKEGNISAQQSKGYSGILPLFTLKLK